MLLKFLLSIFLFFTSVSFALSRVPNALLSGAYNSIEGFKVDFSDKKWIQSELPENLKTKVEALFKISQGQRNSTLSIRIDIDDSSNSIQDYMGKWLKSYAQFKMEVQTYKFFKTDHNETGFVVDVSPNEERKVRQFIFFKNSKAIIFTCSDSIKNFESTVSECNEALKTFSWIQEEPVTSPTAPSPTKSIIN